MTESTKPVKDADAIVPKAEEAKEPLDKVPKPTDSSSVPATKAVKDESRTQNNEGRFVRLGTFKSPNVINFHENQILHFAYVKDKIHVTLIFASFCFNETYVVREVINDFMTRYPTLDIKLAGRADWKDSRYPENTVMLVKTPFLKADMEILRKLNRYDWKAHISFPPDVEIPKKIENLTPQLVVMKVKPKEMRIRDRYIREYIGLAPPTQRKDERNEVLNNSKKDVEDKASK